MPTGLQGEQAHEREQEQERNDSLTKQFLVDALTELQTELQTKVALLQTNLQTKMAQLQDELNGVNGRMDAVSKQLSDTVDRVQRAEARDALTNEDVNLAIADMGDVLSKLRAMTSNVVHWTRVDVGSACYLFNFMIEIAWTLLYHAAIGQRPTHFSKNRTTPNSFNIEPRKYDNHPYNLPEPLKALNPEANAKLVELMTKWSPYFAPSCGRRPAGDKTITYNKMSFWLCTLRFARDVGTHRSLCLVQLPDPAAASGGAAANPMTVKVPMNPAAESYADTFQHEELPPFSDNLAYQMRGVSGRGYCLVNVIRLAQEMQAVADTVHTGFGTVLDLCRPSVPVAGSTP